MKVSKDNPHHYLTSVTNRRLPVFQTECLGRVISDSFSEARKSGGFQLLAYVIMPDHYHLITDSTRKPSQILRYLNGISARRVIDYLKHNDYKSSLAKLRRADKRRGWKYSLWQHHSNVFSINNENTLLEKVHYIHMNPVHAGLVETAGEYLFSSARIWHRKVIEDEPIWVDNVDWREAEPQYRRG